jgi:4-aminobutyrate aminotransferase
MTWPSGTHGNTYGGNPLSCVAALETIRLIQSGYMDNATQQGEYIMDALTEMAGRHPSIGQVRGRGLMIGVEFVKDSTLKVPDKKLRDAVVHHGFESGLLMLGCGQSVVRIAPPLNIERPLVDEALEIFEAALTEGEQHKA